MAVLLLAAVSPGFSGKPTTNMRAPGRHRPPRPRRESRPPRRNVRPNRREVEQRLRELDSPCYETRRMAAERVERWLGMPEMAAMLAEQFQQLVVQPELPLEVRWRISIWRTRLPSVKSEPPQAVSAEELQRLVRQLDDDSYAVRAGACERLQWMAASERLAKPIMLILKRRLADPLLSEDTYRRVESIRNIAWGMWLTGDAADWDLPPVSDAQIDDWLDELGQPAMQHDLRAAMRPPHRPAGVAGCLVAGPRRAAGEGGHRGPVFAASWTGGRGRLRELLDLTRPALVAESWSGRKQTAGAASHRGTADARPRLPHPSSFRSAPTTTRPIA